MRKCIVCGAVIAEHGNNRKYCSEACIRKHEAETRTSYIANRAKRINSVAHNVYWAYGCKCAICGWQASPDLISVKGKLQYSHGNEIHHIIPAREGGTEEDSNLILLCPNHHKQADMGLIDRSTLQSYTKALSLTAEEVHEMRSKVADAIADAIF